MKLKKLLKLLHPNAYVAIMDGDNKIKVFEVEQVDKTLKERDVDRLYRSSGDNQYDFYIKLKV